MRGNRGFRGARTGHPGQHTAAAISEPETAPVFEAARKALLGSAESGNLRAIELLARGALESLSSPADGDGPEAIEPHVAEAAIFAAIVAGAIGPEATAKWLDTFPSLPIVPGEPE